MDYKIIPGILRSTEEDYKKDIAAANQFAKYIQIDIIDGIFAPQKTVQDNVVATYQPSVPVEVDLMVADPESVMRTYLLLPFVDQIIVHVETVKNPQHVIDLAHRYNKKCAFALNPETTIHSLADAKGFDQITFMGVTPGKQGQAFQEEVLHKIREARFRYHELPIEVDGGINPNTLVEAKKAGANLFISGSYIFWSNNPKVKYEELSTLIS